MTKSTWGGMAALVLPIAILFSLCLSEPPFVLLMMLSAIVFHELGHILLFRLTTQRMPALSLECFGLRLSSSLPLLFYEELLIALAGPSVNFILGVLFCRVGGSFFFSLGSMQFLFCFFNLLPYESSDGGRVLFILLCRALSSKSAIKVFTFISAGTLAFFYFLSLYLFYLTGEGLLGVLFSVFSFPWSKVESEGDLRDLARKKEI